MPSWRLGALEASKIGSWEGFGPPTWALRRALGGQVSVWERLGPPSWAHRCLQEIQVGSKLVPRHIQEPPSAAQEALLSLQDASKSLQVWPKRRFGRPEAAQKAPQRPQVDSKKHSKGSPRALDRRKERNCKNLDFTKENHGF